MAEIFVLSKNNPLCSEVFNNLVSTLRDKVKSGVVSVTLSDKKISRSNQQNRYFHKLVELIAEASAEDANKVKKEIKHRIGLIEKEIIGGEMVTSIKSTADMNKDDFSKLIEATIEACDFLNVNYPTPRHFGFDYKEVEK